MRSTVEGAPPLTLAHDPENHPLKIVVNFFCRYAHRNEPQGLQREIPTPVALRPVAPIVGFPVNLDGEPRPETSKVERERALRTLFTKPVAARPLLERPPEKAFRRAHVLAQLARQLHRGRWSAHGSVPHTPFLLLPGTGRGTARRRRVVEGPNGFRGQGTGPSTSLRLVPLPVPGRNDRSIPHHHILKSPNRARSGIGAFRQAAKARPSTSLVCTGSMIPSSHSRAVA